MFRPVFDATDGVDGWASLEVSPLFADDSAKTIHAAAQLHAGAARPNIFIKIPGTLGFGGEESAGAPFQRLDGSAWTTDKDGIALALLSAEMTARTGRYPGALYRDLCTEFGEVFADRVEARANAEQKRALAQLTPQQIAQTELAGEPIDSVLADI